MREEQALTLGQAIHKMTGLAAEHAGLQGRGRIEPGAFADLVLFDPGKVADRATIEEPAARSVGIERVWVNGVPVFADSKATGATPGRIVKRETLSAVGG